MENCLLISHSAATNCITTLSLSTSSVNFFFSDVSNWYSNLCAVHLLRPAIYCSRLGLFKHMNPTLGRKRLPVMNRIQWCSSQNFGKLVNRWRCSLAPHPDIRSVEWGGLWIKDKYSIFEDKLQNSHYAQIHTYILSNKLLRSDSVQSTGLNESKKRENTRELGAWWREGKVLEGSEQA